MYQIQAQIVHKRAGWSSSLGLATFYVNGSGPDGAVSLALAVIHPCTFGAQCVGIHFTIMRVDNHDARVWSYSWDYDTNTTTFREI